MPPARRLLPLGLFLLGSAFCAAFPLASEFRSGIMKDYPLWHGIGQLVVYDYDIYPTDPGQKFMFLYPPFAAVLLAGLWHLGKTGMVVALVLGNVASWYAAGRLSVRLTAGRWPVPLVVEVLPSVLCLPFVYDMFLLGQPNLFLLALVLGGLAAVRAGREWLGGALLAAAVAIKAFPAVLVCYLLWRRNWRAAGGMVLFTAAFLVLVPAPVRGFQRNLRELGTWARGMLLTNDESGFSQRPARNLGWKNQSLMAVGQRYLRPVNADGDSADPAAAPLRVNVADLDHRSAMLAIFGAAGLLGLAYVALMPPRGRRTPASDAAEMALLVTLAVIASPVAHPYYFVWLLFPITVLVHRAATDPSRTARRATWAILGAGMLLFAVGVPAGEPHVVQALGNAFWADLVLAGGLAWHMRRSMAPAVAPAVLPMTPPAPLARAA